MPQNIQLTNCQKNAVNELESFLLRDDFAIILSGPAGTGKSFLIDLLIKELIPKYSEVCELLNRPQLITQLCTAATTNKAAAVITESTNIETPTVHSLMNLVLKNDYKTGDTRTIKNSRKWHVITNTLFIIDEYTYINKDLFSYILETADKDTCKIIFVGDKNQLNPVKESYCLVDTAGYKTIVLQEPVRNAEYPALMDLCNNFREGVISGNYAPIKFEPGVVDLMSIEDVGSEIINVFNNPNHNSKILAYSNKTVITYNDFIREQIGRNPSTYEPGEHLILNTLAKGVSTLSDEFVSMPNEAQVVVYYVDPDIRKYDVVDLDGNIVYTFSYYVIEVEYAGIIGAVRLNIPVNSYEYQAAVKYYSSNKRWVEYFDIKEFFADLRPNFASTVHKSQGSTYDTVYIDMTDITSCNFTNMLNRLLYVAVSRAKKRVVFFGEFKNGFQNLLQN